MKVVSALTAVERLLEQGRVRPGDTLLDSSSGIYAYALALACHKYGLGCHIVGSTTIDSTLYNQLVLLGCRLEQVELSADLKLDQSLRVRRVRQLLAENPHYHWMRQYHDDIHCLGYRPIADRIRAELGGEALTIVGGVGSGASTGALARYLRDAGTDVGLVGVQPFGSITFGAEHVSDSEMIIAGIGSSIPFGNVEHTAYDTLHWISFDTALSASTDLLRRHAVFAGLSSGAAYLAARWERHVRSSGPVLFIAADTGHRYNEAVFSRAESARDIAELAPHSAVDTTELTMPWSRMRWDRAEAPPNARSEEEREAMPVKWSR
ncbi:cysteine synthase A [Actinopolyspora mzabensis]|uniref:Cysteine synthase A n=2 Tax=Actinopolyspora mzabensis TaxID=995066 RepID=A0A1G9ENQ4_ACTMZ|nr:pyridoxal-phosphate dependent enzyme [Actinopolyspora mzabensis]SDK77827.1 cysteine synthase A [Actinopolyspora mzabensis]